MHKKYFCSNKLQYVASVGSEYQHQKGAKVPHYLGDKNRFDVNADLPCELSAC